MNQMSKTAEYLQTIRDFLRYAMTEFERSELFFGHGTDNAWDEALFIIVHYLNLSYDKLEFCLEARLLPEEKHALIEIFNKRIENRIPAAYLVNTAYFADLKFYVDERVLIPRSPIAELIEQGFSPWLDDVPVQRILDIGTGSGCIAIAAAYAFADAEVDAVDLSEDALAVAKKNIQRHHLSDRVHPQQSDLFSALEGKQYELIISNPPYVNAEDLKSMPAEFHYEPRLGLAAGEDGLDLVDEILKQAKNHLSPNGILIVEVGNSQQALIDRYPNIGFVWLEFARGGEGVFLLTADQLGEFTAS